MTRLKLNVPVIGILRGVSPGFFGKLMPRAFEAGLEAIEITINTRDAQKIIAQNKPKVPEGKWLGMGTIRNLSEAKQAVGCGAMFLVTPNLDKDVLAYARKQDIPVIAGALTPTEVYSAWKAGASMVKIFPCSSLGGPDYINALKGPFDQIPLVAVGGVTLENLAGYFEAGARAVGVSTTLFGKPALDNEDIDDLIDHVKTFIDIANTSRPMA